MRKDKTPNPHSLFHAIERRRFGRSICFLCGRQLTNKNRSDEHVFAKWLQNRFSLWNQKLRLLNGTYIPYRSLAIPCCRECNGKHLRSIENRVKAAVLKGYEGVAALDTLTLFLWLGKIFYGLLYKELFLVRDRKSGRKATIMNTSALKEFALHHLFLQAARMPFKFQPALPASIFVFRVNAPNDDNLKFDFRDSLEHLAVSCRIGDVGILAALQDGGAQRDLRGHFWKRYKKHRLGPLHFTELTAMFFYAASLVNRGPKFLIAESSKPVHVVQSPLGGLSAVPIFDDWNHQTFAKYLSALIGLPYERVFIPPSGVVTWLHDAKGQVRLRRVEGTEG